MLRTKVYEKLRTRQPNWFGVWMSPDPDIGLLSYRDKNSHLTINSADKAMFTKDQLSVIRDRLNALLAQLTEIESQGADSRSTVTLDQARVGRLSRMDALQGCLLYTSPSPRDATLSRMPSSA